MDHQHEPWSNVRPMTQSRRSPHDIPKCFKISADVRVAMRHHLEEVGPDGGRFDFTRQDQDRAVEMIDELGIHIPSFSVRHAQAKFSVNQTDTTRLSGIDKIQQLSRHTRFYLCACATDHTAGTRRVAKKRQIAWEEVGCMAWVRVTTTHDHDSDNLLTVDEISGIFNHSQRCQEVVQATIIPRVPLHPDVRTYALGLLKMQVPLSQVQIQCRQFAKGRWGSQMGDDHFRYRFNTKETTSLYRTLRAEISVHQRTLPEDNLDKWLDPRNPRPPTPALTEAVIHYQPYVEGETERFELVISTPEQRELAWKYGHKKLGIMDGTFGVCSAKALLFILMVIDENNHGIPVAFFLFTAKKEHKATHASYDGAILTRFLHKFKVAMGENSAGETFQLYGGLTDNDPREHHSLATEWSNIILLLCLFHIWQAWRGGLNKHLRSVPQGEPRKQVRHRLGNFLRRLLMDIKDYNQAIYAFNIETLYFRQLEGSNLNLLKRQGRGGLQFLTYFRDYLAKRDFWQMWSPVGVDMLAARLGVPASTLPRTTNHLESFNGHLKQRYFSPYMRAGRLPRIDVYVLTLVKEVIPTILEEREDRIQQQQYREGLMSSPGPTPAQRVPTWVEPGPKTLPAYSRPWTPELESLEPGDDDDDDTSHLPDIDNNTEGYGCVIHQ